MVSADASDLMRAQAKGLQGPLRVSSRGSHCIDNVRRVLSLVSLSVMPLYVVGVTVNHLEVCKVVVQMVAVEVMDDLVTPQEPTKRALNYKTVLKHKPAPAGVRMNRVVFTTIAVANRLRISTPIRKSRGDKKFVRNRRKRVLSKLARHGCVTFPLSLQITT